MATDFAVVVGGDSDCQKAFDPYQIPASSCQKPKFVSLRRKRWVLCLPILVTLPPRFARGETHDRMMASAAWWILRQLALSVQARFAIPTRLSLFRASVIPISMKSLPSSGSECQPAGNDLLSFHCLIGEARYEIYKEIAVIKAVGSHHSSLDAVVLRTFLALPVALSSRKSPWPDLVISLPRPEVQH